MLASASTSTCNKSTICLQPLKTSSNVNYGKRVSLKIKSKAQDFAHNGSAGQLATSTIRRILHDDMEMSTLLPAAAMELLTLEGRLMNGGQIFQQNFLIRSFDVDPDYKVSIKAIMNYLQDASVNYRKKMGMSGENLLGHVTPEMSKRDLLWVYRCMHIKVDRYPSWNDFVQLHHWFSTSGRTGLRCHWVINDIKTGETLVRASSLFVMMNKKTRKVCKLPEEVENELKPYQTINAESIVENERNSCPKVETMNHIRNGLTPRWNDLDYNYHVNNSKYVDWILESVPRSPIHNQELCSINIEYRRECLKDDVIQSLSKVVTDEQTNHQGIELEHLLRLESGPEVLRAKTAWRPKSVCRKSYED
ncbi:Acyl-ACP thioesterase [Corchorus capsularis]|uniref:Acyl-[acyl-carrier-protein] hydrolase n=1 Tax=Corchorus capsularis TaxID=210143 RepID=A0A1R3G7W7_COCAP|nr:Acyl-ACP thioesterase [Corchorus capsularis]